MVFMKKLSFDALQNKANDIASMELLSSINGGVENSCHTVFINNAPAPKEGPMGDSDVPWVH
jgi:hypothetical protein